MRIVPSRIQGLTLIEVLIVLAIIGIILGLGVFNGRQALTGQQEQAAVNSIRQSAWQGATAAAARGARVFLRVEDNELLLRLENQENGRVIRRESLPRDFVSNIPGHAAGVHAPRKSSAGDPAGTWPVHGRRWRPDTGAGVLAHRRGGGPMRRSVAFRGLTMVAVLIALAILGIVVAVITTATQIGSASCRDSWYAPCEVGW